MLQRAVDPHKIPTLAETSDQFVVASNGLTACCKTKFVAHVGHPNVMLGPDCAILSDGTGVIAIVPVK